MGKRYKQMKKNNIDLTLDAAVIVYLLFVLTLKCVCTFNLGMLILNLILQITSCTKYD